MKRGPLPNFLIVGAMRSGTSSLADWLKAHPDVYLPEVKELHFFDRRFDRGIDWYRGQFAGASDQRRIGEATQTYMYDREAAALMAELLPSALLIAVVRNPVDRAYSHYALGRALGRERESFEEALRREPEQLNHADRKTRLNSSYVGRGRYVDQLAFLATRYPREAIHVEIFEELTSKPRERYATICRFLGVDERVVPASVGRRVNAIRSYRSPAMRRAANRLPHGLGKVVNRLNVRPSDIGPMLPETRALLLERFREDNERLAEWIGRDLRVWER